MEKDCIFEKDGGVWVSAGHGMSADASYIVADANAACVGPWGISLSQGTGRVLAEMVLGVKTSIDTRPYGL